MIKVYHNPRCTKSRQALAYLDEKGVRYEVRLYMKEEESLTFDELFAALDTMNMEAIDLVRRKEAIWKEQFANLELEDDEIIYAMIEHPKLMERPIVINGDKAVVARPTEKIDEVL